MQKILNVFGIITICFVVLACNQVDKTPKLGEEFELKSDETANIENTGIYLKGKGSGHTIESPKAHTEYCIFEVKYDGESSDLELKVGKTFDIGKYDIKVNGISLFKSCKLIVRNKR